MKIIFVIESLAKGGAERVVSLLSQEMERQGHQVVIVTFTPIVTYNYGGQLKCLNLPMVGKGKVNLLKIYSKRIFALRRIFKSYQPDKIFSFMEVSSISSILASTETIACIRIDPASLSPMLKRVMKFLYPLTQGIICNAQEQLKSLGAILKHKNVQVIYNPVVSDVIKQLKFKPIAIKTPFILGVGRLEKQKRFDLLIDAYAKSSARHELDLIILGEGKERSVLEKQITTLGLGNKVKLLGTVDNPYAYMSRCVFFVLSSDFEGFPNALAEAMACGAAVISTDCPTGPKELIQHEKNGLLVPINNSRALTKAIDELYNNPALCTIFQKNVVSSIQHLKITAIAEKFLAV